MEFLIDYGSFLAKSVTILVVIGLVIAMIANARKQEGQDKGKLEVVRLNDRYREFKRQMELARLQDDKKALKAAQKRLKQQGKEKQAADKPALWVIEFQGDIQAKPVARLGEEISAVLSVARPGDELLLKLESGGGVMHGYGLAASQLDRVREANIRLTVSVDKVAASGGYMMACVADHILSAPFAIIGSIGVLAQIPNFNKLLKKHNVDLELHTAGEYKRTLTLFGENTDEGREKFRRELQEAHELFKQFVGKHRPDLNLEEVGTGEIWFGEQAIGKGLVDELGTSDAYIQSKLADHQVYEVKFTPRRSLSEKLGKAAEAAGAGATDAILERAQAERFAG